MSYQIKRTIVTVLVGIIILISYLTYTLTRYNRGLINLQDLSFWALTILIFIGIGIGLTIVTQIIFHIAYSIVISIKEKVKNPAITDKEIEKIIHLNMVTDEMDKLVELKSMRVGFIVSGIGFVFGLLLILFGYDAYVLINIIFLSFSIGSIGEGLMQIYYYKRGIRHG
ncbi:hypothetical protein [Liberiplasma polymorphum]|uniref:hypothetical protein n=1 Tax=Liberiplasma polymorphum TaxID=3374570 RepID=UPI0037751BAE